jgi:hypothetical protein
MGYMLKAVDKYYEVAETIAAISSCGSVPTLLQIILERLERFHPPELVGLIMGQVAFSRSGMMEAELCRLAGDGMVVGTETGFAWAYFFNAVAPLLRNKGGCFSTLHSEVRDAIFARYLPVPGLIWATASIQFHYFHAITDGGNPKSNSYKLKTAKTRDKAFARACVELDDVQGYIDAQVVENAQDVVHAHHLERPQEGKVGYSTVTDARAGTKPAAAEECSAETVEAAATVTGTTGSEHTIATADALVFPALHQPFDFLGSTLEFHAKRPLVVDYMMVTVLDLSNHRAVGTLAGCLVRVVPCISCLVLCGYIVLATLVAILCCRCWCCNFRSRHTHRLHNRIRPRHHYRPCLQRRWRNQGVR